MAELRGKVQVNSTLVTPKPLVLLNPSLTDCLPCIWMNHREADFGALGDRAGVQQSRCSAFLPAAPHQSASAARALGADAPGC